MSFWRTFGFTVSPVEAILEKEEYTLEELLDEEEVLQECKAQNNKLLEFLVQDEILDKLFEYITQEAPEDADQKRRFKYPFVACELLCSEVWQICDAIYNDTKYLDKLYAFLDEEPFTSLIISYVCRVAGVLLHRKISETIAYMKKKENIIANFTKHLENSAVMELLLKIIGCEETIEGTGILEWLCETNLITYLVEKFDPKLEADVHENASQALLDIITVSLSSVASPLMTQLTSEETMKSLMNYILEENESSGSVLLHGLTVINELLRKYAAEDTSNSDTPFEELDPILRVLAETLPAFFDLLIKPKEITLLTACGELTPPFGFGRLKLMELFLSLLKTKFKCVDEKLIELKLLPGCLDLFFQYKWNNFVHHVVEQMIIIVLDGYNQDLILTLFNEGDLLNRIIEAEKEAKEDYNRAVFRRTYMGFLNIITGQIENVAPGLPRLQELLEKNEEWKAYLSGPYATTKQIEQQSLAPRPIEFANDSSDDEDDDTIFQKYRLGPTFTENFANDLDEDDEDDDNDDMDFHSSDEFDSRNDFNTDDRNYDDEDSDSDDDYDGEYSDSDSLEDDGELEVETQDKNVENNETEDSETSNDPENAEEAEKIEETETKTEEPKSEEPKEESKTEESEKEEPQKEESEKEESKTESEEPKAEEPETQKEDQPKIEENVDQD